MLTQSELKEILSYDRRTGIFRWLKPSRRIKVGDVAGCVTQGYGKGYVVISFKKRQYFAHRLAWLYVTGRWPKMLDHRDRNKLNNVFANLRETTPALNRGNSLKAKGISQVPGGYWVVMVAGKYFGRFLSQTKALAVRKQAARAHFGEFAP
jgi:hypothetical protein